MNKEGWEKREKRIVVVMMIMMMTFPLSFSSSLPAAL